MEIFFNRNIDDECHQKMKDFTAAGNDVTGVAFPAGGGNRWSIVTKSGAFFNRNIPDECHQKMRELSQNGAKIIRVAFPPQGGTAGASSTTRAYSSTGTSLTSATRRCRSYRRMARGSLRRVPSAGRQQLEHRQR